VEITNQQKGTQISYQHTTKSPQSERIYKNTQGIQAHKTGGQQHAHNSQID